MSVVRLELTVPDEDACDVADKLARGYVSVIREQVHGNVLVEVRTDAEALRERVILQAAGHLMRPVREC